MDMDEIDTESWNRMRDRALAENETFDWAVAANKAAEFLPMMRDGELPEIKVAGVAVTVYATREGELRVSVHVDTGEIDPKLLRDEGKRVATTITVNGEEVFDWMADWT